MKAIEENYQRITDDRRSFDIRVSNQWRIVFHWHEDTAYEVELTDYH